MSDAKHLWEIDHPYYCNEGNWYSGDCHTKFDSWGDYVAEFGDSDLDMNLVFRWDWHAEGSDWMEEREGEGDELLIFIMHQRKARCVSHAIRVTKDDESAVREWLTPRLRRLMDLWTPLSTVTP